MPITISSPFVCAASHRKTCNDKQNEPALSKKENEAETKAKAKAAAEGKSETAAKHEGKSEGKGKGKKMEKGKGKGRPFLGPFFGVHVIDGRDHGISVSCSC